MVLEENSGGDKKVTRLHPLGNVNVNFIFTKFYGNVSNNVEIFHYGPKRFTDQQTDIAIHRATASMAKMKKTLKFYIYTVF